MSLELTFLGTGTSAGVPMIACDCAVCRSDDPHDKRTRVSALVGYPDPEADDAQAPQRHLLIDTGPDLRDQALRHDMWRLDGVLYTHAHGDHIYGVDELRRFNVAMGGPLDVYAEPEVIEALHEKFRYIFDAPSNVNQSFVPQLISHPIDPGQAMELFGARWTPIRLMHGRLPVLGFRVDWCGRSIAYCTDCSRVPPESHALLEGLDLLVIDALRYRHHPTHMTVDQALEVIEQVKPGEAYFTHIAHDIAHAELEPKLPEHVHLSYDGLTLRYPARRRSETPRPDAAQHDRAG